MPYVSRESEFEEWCRCRVAGLGTEWNAGAGVRPEMCRGLAGTGTGTIPSIGSRFSGCETKPPIERLSLAFAMRFTVDIHVCMIAFPRTV